eukprot:4891244-Pleurochrysis_carterae.AAC.1
MQTGRKGPHEHAKKAANKTCSRHKSAVGENLHASLKITKRHARRVHWRLQKIQALIRTQCYSSTTSSSTGAEDCMRLPRRRTCCACGVWGGVAAAAILAGVSLNIPSAVLRQLAWEIALSAASAGAAAAGGGVAAVEAPAAVAAAFGVEEGAAAAVGVAAAHAASS